MPDFDDLISANQEYAADFAHGDLEAPARAGLAMVTCMDSRIDPLRIVGLGVGDAKIVRNPGGRVTDQALAAVVLAVNLLGATRVMVVPHTRCAMASSSEQELRDRVGAAVGLDASWQEFGAVDDQLTTLASDVARIRSHPLVPRSVAVGGFVYDVTTGLLEQKL